MEISFNKPYKQFGNLIYSEAVKLNGYTVQVNLKSETSIIGLFQALTDDSSSVGQYVIQNQDVMSVYLLSKPKV